MFDDSRLDEKPLAGRTAIVIVHGVQPHARYQIQDECATNLCAQLNADPYWKAGKPWTLDVVQPHVKKDAALQATITRVHRQDDFLGAAPFFDVVEAYWSPLDKGKANFAGILAWLLRTLFVPLNTTAAFSASTAKTAYDLAFTLVAALAGVSGLVASLYLLVIAANRVLVIQGCSASTGCAYLDALALWKASIPKDFSTPTLVALAITAAGGFLVVQALKGLWSLLFHWKASSPAHALKRLALIIAVGLVGGAVMLIVEKSYEQTSPGFAQAAYLFVFAAAVFETGRTILQQFFVYFLQDVMIYTTRDQNSDFYGLRSKILELVSAQIEAACSDDACDGRGYERVFVLGHSLGSTICLDAIIQFYQACRQGSKDWTSFQRLRGFVTFGTALEKTKYFTDTLDPSPSAAADQWRNDLYGTLFTLAPSVLDVSQRSSRTGIFWVNYWYPLDIVSNAIDSYRSYMRPGDPLHQASRIRRLVKAAIRATEIIAPVRVCRNEKREHPYVVSGIVPHNEYLHDDRFWQSKGAIVDADIKQPEDFREDRLGVLDIVARCAAADRSTKAVKAADEDFASSGKSGADAFSNVPVELSGDDIARRIQRLDPSQAGSYRDRYSAGERES